MSRRVREFFSASEHDPLAFRILTLGAAMGLCLLALLGGLFWTQVAGAQRYGESLQEQTIRRIRVPALRGDIADRHGQLLATNRPSYTIVLYIEELRRQRRRGTMAETVRVARETVDLLAERLGLPSPVTDTQIQRHIEQALALPLELWKDVPQETVAVFSEKCGGLTGVDLEVRPVRHYRYGAYHLAAHTLGYVRQTAYLRGMSREEFDYFMPDMEGHDGLEREFDEWLRGRAGSQTVLVDASGFRRKVLEEEPMRPGMNLTLTLDAGAQYVVERVLKQQRSAGACVVMDPRNGDLLALASSPGFDPNWFVPALNAGRWAELNNPISKPLLNRAISEHYAPGSIFKIVVSLAGLESGTIGALSRATCHGVFTFPSGKTKRCWARQGHGEVNFEQAFKHSCDVFFYKHGIEMGPEVITDMARRFGLAQRTQITLLGEVSGVLPGAQGFTRNWFDGDTANYAIGQGPLAVTPLQMAMMTAAVANGGRVLWPRLVERIEETNASGKGTRVLETFPPRLAQELKVSHHALHQVRRAMLQVVEDPDGTGRRAALQGVRVAGKTGTAEFRVGSATLHRVWFVAFAPYEAPRFAVALVLEDGDTGGRTAAPLVGEILSALLNAPHLSGREGGGDETAGD